MSGKYRVGQRVEVYNYIYGIDSEEGYSIGDKGTVIEDDDCPHVAIDGKTYDNDGFRGWPFIEYQLRALDEPDWTEEQLKHYLPCWEQYEDNKAKEES